MLVIIDKYGYNRYNFFNTLCIIINLKTELIFYQHFANTFSELKYKEYLFNLEPSQFEIDGRLNSV